MLRSQCPECGSIEDLSIQNVPPWEHDHSEEWETKVECEHCNQYEEWGSG